MTENLVTSGKARFASLIALVADVWADGVVATLDLLSGVI
jgi:hypothetical protein